MNDAVFFRPRSERRFGSEAEVPQHLALHEDHLAAGRDPRPVSGCNSERLGRRSIVGSLLLLVRWILTIFSYHDPYFFSSMKLRADRPPLINSYNGIKAYVQEGRRTELGATEHLVSAAEAGPF